MLSKLKIKRPNTLAKNAKTQVKRSKAKKEEKVR